jgi:hypothetical protein
MQKYNGQTSYTARQCAGVTFALPLLSLQGPTLATTGFMRALMPARRGDPAKQ